MLEAYGDIWEEASYYDAVVITTNGYVKQNGEAVMGRGIAKAAAEKWPWLPATLGTWLRAAGNIVGIFPGDTPQHIITMPAKPAWGPKGEPGWKAKADMKLIRYSAEELVLMADEYDLNQILMPRPGCGNGGLKWENVKPVLEEILDDRFTVMEFAV